MVRTVATKAKDAVTDAAQRSARGVKSIAGDALGAAAPPLLEQAVRTRANAAMAASRDLMLVAPSTTGSRR